jgi:hypothetical protein
MIAFLSSGQQLDGNPEKPSSDGRSALQAELPETYLEPELFP